MQRISITLAVVAVICLSSCKQAQNTNEDSLTSRQTETLFPKGNKIISNNFTGTAWLHMMIANDSTLYARIGNVTFLNQRQEQIGTLIRADKYSL